MKHARAIICGAVMLLGMLLAHAGAATADSFIPPPGWIAAPPPYAIPSPSRMLAFYVAPYNEGSVHPNINVIESPGSIDRDFEDGFDAAARQLNATNPSKGRISCRGAAANWWQFDFSMYGRDMHGLQLELPRGSGVRIITYTRAAGTQPDGDAQRALRYACDHRS